jgi:hypothetical protein
METFNRDRDRLVARHSLVCLSHKQNPRIHKMHEDAKEDEEEGEEGK